MLFLTDPSNAKTESKFLNEYGPDIDNGYSLLIKVYTAYYVCILPVSYPCHFLKTVKLS